MKKTLRIIALSIITTAAGIWIVAGANFGWTKDSREIKTLDPVTGIEGISYEKRFFPGLDFLGVALLGAGILTGLSFLFPTKSNASTNQN